MKYTNTKVKYWTDVWKDVNSFDVLSTRDIAKKYREVYEFIDKFPIDKNLEFSNKGKHLPFMRGWNSDKEDSSVDIAYRYSVKEHHMVYLELPYKFFYDNFTEWLYYPRDNDVPFSWKFIKDHIENDTVWGRGTSTDEYGEYFNTLSYRMYLSFKRYGVANPIFNNALTFPKRSTHMMGYIHMIKSDVPILFSIPDGYTKFTVFPNKFKDFNQDERADTDRYFNGKYLMLEIDIDNKVVQFIDEDDKEIGVYSI